MVDNYIIIGGSGYLGTNFINQIHDAKIIATYSDEQPVITAPNLIWGKLDITNPNTVAAFLETLQPDIKNSIIIYLAAYHHPDKVEKNPELAYNINITSLEYFLKKMGVPKNFYYSSTQSVYGESIDGKVFSEDDECSPANLYGRQKIEAEKLVIKHGYNVIRYPFLMGPSLTDRKHFHDVIVENISTGKTMDMFSDSYHNTLSFSKAAELTLALDKKLNGKKVGIINISADKALSKYDIGLTIADNHNIDRILIKPVSMHEDANFSATKRASSTFMSNKKLKSFLGLDKVENGL